MKHPLAPVCLAWLLAVAASSAVDLTPHFVTRGTGEGAIQVPYFLEGETRYSLQIPPGVRTLGGAGEVTFYFNELDGASFTMKASPFKPDVPFTGPSLETYRQALSRFLPPGAQAPTPKSEDPDPLPGRGWAGHRFTLDYKLPGRAFVQSVTYLNFSDRQQIVLIITAPAPLFQKAEEISLRMMNSWRDLSPHEDLAVPPTS